MCLFIYLLSCLFYLLLLLLFIVDHRSKKKISPFPAIPIPTLRLQRQLHLQPVSLVAQPPTTHRQLQILCRSSATQVLRLQQNGPRIFQDRLKEVGTDRSHGIIQSLWSWRDFSRISWKHVHESNVEDWWTWGFNWFNHRHLINKGV